MNPGEGLPWLPGASACPAHFLRSAPSCGSRLQLSAALACPLASEAGGRRPDFCSQRAWRRGTHYHAFSVRTALAVAKEFSRTNWLERSPATCSGCPRNNRASAEPEAPTHAPPPPVGKTQIPLLSKGGLTGPRVGCQERSVESQSGKGVTFRPAGRLIRLFNQHNLIR